VLCQPAIKQERNQISAQRLMEVYPNEAASDKIMVSIVSGRISERETINVKIAKQLANFLIIKATNCVRRKVLLVTYCP
jgi:hypothetical protein